MATKKELREAAKAVGEMFFYADCKNHGKAVKYYVSINRCMLCQKELNKLHYLSRKKSKTSHVTKKALIEAANASGEKFFYADCKKHGTAIKHYVSINRCVLCQKETDKRYYASHKESKAAYARENRKKLYEYVKEWQKENKEKMTEYRKRWYKSRKSKLSTT